jgi:hypothetical protein
MISSNLAVLLQEQGELARARSFYERALAIREAAHSAAVNRHAESMPA